MPRNFYIHYNAPGVPQILCGQRYGPKTRHSPNPEETNCPRCLKILARNQSEPRDTQAEPPPSAK